MKSLYIISKSYQKLLKAIKSYQKKLLQMNCVSQVSQYLLWY